MREGGGGGGGGGGVHPKQSQGPHSHILLMGGREGKRFFWGLKFWPKGIFASMMLGFFGLQKKQGVFWVLYFSSAEINN